MKVFKKKHNEEFEPFEMSIRFESKQEVYAFFNLFNHPGISNWLSAESAGAIDSTEIMSLLESGVVGEDNEYLDYKPCFVRLCDALTFES